MKKRFISPHLLLLIAVLFLGYATSMGIDWYITSRQQVTDKQLLNYQNRNEIGRAIHLDIIRMKALFFQLAPTKNIHGQNLIAEDIVSIISTLKSYFTILQKGGQFNKTLTLNLPETLEAVEILEYNPLEGEKYVLELIELRPKLVEINNSLKELHELVRQRSLYRNKQFQFSKTNKLESLRFKGLADDMAVKVKKFLEPMPALFLRMEENANRLQYDSNNKLTAIKGRWHREKEINNILYLSLTFIVMFIVAILIYKIAGHLAAQNRQLKFLALEAQQSSHAKSEFLANMSHEIRTPLNAVLGMSQLLIDTPLNNQQQDYLTKINRSSKLLLGVINDVLDVSKIEAGKLELDIQPFDIHDVMNDMRTMFSAKAQEKGLELIVKADTNMPRTLIGDSMRLGQVITNLLSNAMKFTESGHVSLHIDKAIEVPASPNSYRLTFSVSDSGIGMNEEQIKRLFKPFSQADSSTTRQYGGTGLGLVISSRLVEAMGGKLEVTSAHGEGSTFSFAIELPKASDKTGIATGKKRRIDRQADSTLTPSFAGYTILLVEDNELNQEVAAAFIAKTTAKVITAENGKVALQCYEENSIDLILMDLQMPVMDGFDATAQIRRQEHAAGNDAHVPIIVLSAAVMEADRKKATKAGADGHIGKPIDSGELYAVMGQYLKSSGAISKEQTSTEETKEEFPILDGFDLARGKASSQGKRDTYMKLLRSFNTQITGSSADFPDRISTLTFAEIQHEAHTIKGVAATVGALRVADAAATIDKASAEQMAPTKSMVDELRTALQSAKEELSPHLSIEKSAMTVDKEEGRKAIDTLLAILRNSEFPEDDLSEKVVAFVQVQAGSEKADVLRNSIEEFDMDTAVDLLEKIQKGE